MTTSRDSRTAGKWLRGSVPFLVEARIEPQPDPSSHEQHWQPDHEQIQGVGADL
jgi:hypothetical protein